MAFLSQNSPQGQEGREMHSFEKWWETEGQHLYEDAPKGSVGPKWYAVAGWNAGAKMTIQIFEQKFKGMRQQLRTAQAEPQTESEG